MKSFIKKYQQIFIFFCAALLCSSGTLHAMRSSQVESEDFQELSDLTPAQQKIVLTINRTILCLEHSYQRLITQHMLQCQPAAARQIMLKLNDQLIQVHNAFQSFMEAFPESGKSRALNTRCAQCAALINRILVHLDHARQTLESDLIASRNAFTHACELKQALNARLRATTINTDLIHECERTIVHIATSADQLQKVTPKKLRGFCAGLASLAQSALTFAHEQKQEQLHHASSAELLEQLGPDTEAQTQTFSTITNAIHSTCATTDHYLSVAADVMEKNTDQNLANPNIQQAVEFLIDPSSGPTMLRIAQRLPAWLLRRTLPLITDTTHDNVESTIRILKSGGIQPSDFALLHPKLRHLLGITAAHQAWAQQQVPIILRTATDFLRHDNVAKVKKKIVQVQHIVTQGSHAVKYLNSVNQETRTHEEEQTTTLRALGEYDKQAQWHVLREHEQRKHAQATAQHALKQLEQIRAMRLTGTAFPVTPTQALLLGARTTGESPEVSARTRLNQPFLRHTHSQDQL